MSRESPSDDEVRASLRARQPGCAEALALLLVLGCAAAGAVAGIALGIERAVGVKWTAQLAACFCLVGLAAGVLAWRAIAWVMAGRATRQVRASGRVARPQKVCVGCGGSSPGGARTCYHCGSKFTV